LHIARRAESGDGVAAELRALQRVASQLTDESNPRDRRDAGCSCEPVQHARHRQTRQPASIEAQAGCEMRRSMAQSPGGGRASPQRPHRCAPAEGCQVMARARLTRERAAAPECRAVGVLGGGRGRSGVVLAAVGAAAFAKSSEESEHLSRGAAEKLRRKMCGREHRNRGKCRISAAHLISPRSYITRGALVPTLLAPAPVGHCSIQQRPPP
jgi:hypothetical protein